MRGFYFWFCIAAIIIGTGINYSVSGIIGGGASRSWVGTGTGTGSTGGGWHK